MKTIIVSFLSMTLICACGPTLKRHPDICRVEFTKPMNGQKFIMSPNTLSVKHIGKCWPEEGKFEAWVDIQYESQRNITNLFNYNQQSWQSQSIKLPKGNHNLFAVATLSTPNNSSEVNTGLVDINILPSPDSTIKIMPLGDSITQGCCLDPPGRDCEIGYRYRLYTNLTDARYNVEFVGSVQHPDPEHEERCESLQYPLDFDRFHEGRIGRPVNELVGNMDGILDANPPHVILLHIGSNDINLNLITEDCNNDENVENEPVPCAVYHVKTILDEIDTWEIENNHDIIVFLALIIKGRQSDSSITDYNDLVEDYNNKLEDMVTNRINNDNDKIILVDMENGAGLKYEDDMKPNSPLHPLPSGYEKIADLWFRHVVSFLPIPE